MPEFTTSVKVAVVVGAPYAAAVSGVFLGVGGVLVDRPLVAACGAAAGVAAGVLERCRSARLNSQVEGMRDRLRKQRAEADATGVQLRADLSAARTALWERRLHDTLRSMPAPAASTESGVLQGDRVWQMPQNVAELIAVAEFSSRTAPLSPALGLALPSAGPSARVIDLRGAREEAASLNSAGEDDGPVAAAG